MMLAIVAVAVGTVIAATVLTTNDNSARIGQNAVSAASSEWSGRAAAKIVVAAMQTDTDWQSIIMSDNLLDNWSLAGANVDVSITNLSGGPVSAGDREVLMTVTADVGGVITVVEQQVSLASENEVFDDIDTSLGEFAIFATDRIVVDDGARLRVWKKSEEATSRPEFKLGTSAVYARDVDLGTGSAFRNVQFFPCFATAASIRMLISDEMFSGGRVLPVSPPIIPVLLTEEDRSKVYANTVLDGTPGTLSFLNTGGMAFDSCTVTGEARLVFDESRDPNFMMNNLTISNGGTVEIRGDVKIVVRNDIFMDNRAAIELSPGSKLMLIVGNRLIVRNSVIGLPETLADIKDRRLSDIPEYQNPHDVHICALDATDGGIASAAWQFSENSIALGVLHAPVRTVSVANSAIIGRVTAQELNLNRFARVLYDPALDVRMGFTDPSSPMYDGGMLRNEYLSIFNFLELIEDDDVDDWSAAEAVLAMMYSNVMNKPAFLRHLMSVVNGVDYTLINDPDFTVLDSLATTLSTNYGLDAATLRTVLDDLLSMIRPDYAVNLMEINVSGTPLGVLLGDATSLGMGGSTTDPDDLDDIDLIDNIFGPGMSGNYTVRRAGRARARSIEELAEMIESQ
ncbi:hypothetical protein JYT11_00770 [Planctomycetaceae bacterium AH-315-I19]|nr:hypothetical protein [Planctomycetaceae bacterium AH-315-I19]